MVSKNTKKLIIFWLLAIPLLLGWFIFWEFKNNRLATLEKVSSLAPLEEGLKNEIGAAFDIYKYLSLSDETTRTYLLLFQNDMELRPSGGFLGSFGILKIKNGSIESLEIHDANAFDKRITEIITPPEPMVRNLRINAWQMRDSNWFPDFPESAQKVEEFYHLGKGQEDFQGIFSINTNVLEEILRITGPVKIDGFDQEFSAENAVLEIEYEVEKAYEEKGLTFDERKLLLKKLGQALREKVEALGWQKKMGLAKSIEKLLGSKDIQLFFKDSAPQKIVESVNWGGQIDKVWQGDYLNINMANLGAWKSDLKMERRLEYVIDFSNEKPEAELTFFQKHTAEQKDWMTKDYQGYLRIYAPKGAWLKNSSDYPQMQFSEEYGKKVFGTQVFVKLGTENSLKFAYSLPEDLNDDSYKLLIQKQSGMKDLPVKVKLIHKNGEVEEREIILDRDRIIQF